MLAKGYSFWLMPTGEVYNKFSSLIEKLAEKYSIPLFEPHITLLGEIQQPEDEIIQKAQLLITEQKPFPITLRMIDYQDFYFRALFVKADIPKSLRVLHNRAKEIFEMQYIPDYMAHLSLLYGTFPQEVKEKIIEKIGKDQTTELTINGIDLFKTTGEVNTWYRIRKFPFL
ncbi:2'-5' RNA ligase family protein [Candidatus Gottesmanbacteria bacterium]|nr:2'-5' RNA ligase family protein [Candidatus Gottesmanbacteria bacterium]